MPGGQLAAMVEQDLRLLISVVVSAEDERQAHDACRDLVDRIGGRVVEAADCSDEEPGCWSVTIGKDLPSVQVHNDAAALARSVRTFVRELAPDSPLPRVCCEPPTAWTVLDDPELIGKLVEGAERLLVEAWSEQAPFQPVSYQEPATPEPVPVEHTTRLRLQVDVAVLHPAGAQWQARALASRITEAATITEVTQGGDGVSVHLDLGRWPQEPAQAVAAAAEALGRPEWSPMELRPDGTVSQRWLDILRPTSGITSLELVADVAEAEVAWPTEDEPPVWREPGS